jgi:organic hydroperoxide reductase OsmC/OhrA
VGDNHDYSLAAELQVKLPGIEKSVAEELIKAADQMCPYSKAIRGNVPVKLTVL